MRRTLSVFILLLSYCCIDAQDLIITNTGDSIECRIHQVRTDQIVYVININGRHEGKILDLADVADIQYNYKSVENATEEHEVMDSLKRKRSGIKNYSKVHISLGGGFGYQISNLNPNIPDNLASQANEIRWGPHFSGELAFFANQSFAFGAKFSRFKVKKETQIVTNTGSLGQEGFRTFSDNISIMYLGPMICFRLFTNEKPDNFFLFDLSAGYLSYQNSSFLLIDFYNVEGKALGFSLGASYNLNKFQFKASLMTGRFNAEVINLRLNEVIAFDKIDKESTTRLDFTIGIRL